MEKQIEIAWLNAKERFQINRSTKKYRRQKQRRQDEFILLQSFQSSSIRLQKDQHGENIVTKYAVDDHENIFNEREIRLHQYNSNEKVPQQIVEQDHEVDSVTYSSSTDDNQLLFYSETEVAEISVDYSAQQLLHNFTNVKTNEYCEVLLKTLRDARLSKVQSNNLISLLKSALPEPNNMPSSLKELLAKSEIEDLFLRHRICISCASEISYELDQCNICMSDDQTKFGIVYDIDVNRVVPIFIKKRHRLIQQYKRVIENSWLINAHDDIPNGRLYKRLLEECDGANLISFILHIDGISLTKSNKLKMWLLSGSIVELPPKLRHLRQNMLALSIWIGYKEPSVTLWLDRIIESLLHLKSKEIMIDSKLSYKIKVFALTGDCPALRLALNFIGHGGYWCCWFCYIKGIHEAGKRQYRYEHSIKQRTEESYLVESSEAEHQQKTIFGHHGVSPLAKILDIPLPSSIIIDYMHVSLLGHGKRIVLTIYDQLRPNERLALDKKLKEQQFPHFFNRRMRPISDFGFVKATEIRNILFYGSLPLFQSYLSIEQLAHLALFICGVRLFHGHLLIGCDVSLVAQEMIDLFYKDHDDFYQGLQNFVLHLHTHFGDIYKNYGPLSNLGCFGQEDFIGYISSNHHGTRYHGELICHYYNIDFCLKNNHSISTIDEPMDLLHQSLDLDQIEEAAECHRLSCDCNQINQCMFIYRRCSINQFLYHSILYEKSQKSISYFVEYFTEGDSNQQKFGKIQWFFVCGSKSFALIRRHSRLISFSNQFRASKYYETLKTALDSLFIVLQTKSTKSDIVPIECIDRLIVITSSMEYDGRSKRTIKRRTIFSPSDASAIEYCIVHVPELHRDFLVKKSSLKHHSNGKVSTKISGRDTYGELITSGTKSHCEAELNDRVVEARRSILDEASSDSDDSITEMQSSNRTYSYSASKSFKLGANSTPHPRRAKLRDIIVDNSSSQSNELHRSRSEVDFFHKLPSPYRVNTCQANTNDRSVIQNNNQENDSAELEFLKKSKVESRIDRLLSSLNQKLDFVARKVQKVSQSTAFFESQMDIYRNEKDQFPDEVLWNNQNLLDFHGKNPGDYGRKLLRVLYSENELKTSMLPSSVSSRYSKPKLDEERFTLLNTAMRVKYRINHTLYPEFYKNLIRKKLSDFLLEEERRAKMKARRDQLRESTIIGLDPKKSSVTIGNCSNENEDSTSGHDD